ncbi:NAD-dependent epimerase/dehydratase family protein [Daejeonella oryzae]|uniref:NAD-dependent epimerase/dehydratase family protein n=1 Tax=Daejeonella oryzae TaxID=1122943 RepID=UPI000479E496|nr:NAD(P)-dependent oxidoreductase [Daejeonella oryzae]
MGKLKVGITGAGGFIGTHLRRDFKDEIINTVLITGTDENVITSTDLIVVDLFDINQLRRVLSDVNVVIHLAGLNSVRDSFESPIESLRVNTLGTTSLLNVCKDIKIDKVIIISSAEVYGRPIFNPVSEYSLLQPLSPYGVSKVAIEQIAYVYHISKSIKFKILRPFSIYGPSMSKKSLMYDVYKKTLEGGDLRLFNLSSVRDYCYVGDLVRAIKNALLSEFKGFEIFNIGTGIGTSAKQIATMIQEIMHTSGNICENSKSDRPRFADIDLLISNNMKAETELDWKPETSLINGLKKTILSFQNE